MNTQIADRIRFPFFVLVLMAGAGCASTRPAVVSPPASAVEAATASVERVLRSCTSGQCGFRLDPGSRIDSVQVESETLLLRVYFNKAFLQVPFREAGVLLLESAVRDNLGDRFSTYRLEMNVGDVPLPEFVPNAFRPDSVALDTSRRPQEPSRGRPLVTRLDRADKPDSGLAGRHIAVWPSHGWYYEEKLDRWEWQRARLFRTVEDLLPMSFIVPYLAPMLELAGAEVYMPRERDPQANESVVDNDVSSRAEAAPPVSRDIAGSTPGHTVSMNGESDQAGRAETSGYFESSPPANAWRFAPRAGFGMPHRVLTDGQNPFLLGTARIARTDSAGAAVIRWIPGIPETGDYAVYISYARLDSASTDARYTVYHAGGGTDFSVDQSMGGGTWIYLGTFRFRQGVHPDSGSVRLTSLSSRPGFVLSADAVRFGGGIGNVQRGGAASGRPRYTEGARYYMQFAGMPDTLVYSVTEQLSDYIDDYRGRAEWVNYLRGAPYGPNKNRSIQGLHIPVDVSLAFHTDAGITHTDSTIGTLMIYSSEGADSVRVFPDGMSRLANRDLGDLMQTQIVDDIQALYDSLWTRRSIWDRDYSEAVRPNVPGVLLELLSHQNFADMRFALDPGFRFNVSRSIYKAILRFVATQNDQPYVVAPLPVTHMQTHFEDSAHVVLSWLPTEDPLEPSATPAGYVVYTRDRDGGFDNGRYVSEPRFVGAAPPPGTIRSYRVAAVNDGGESFPSEILSVGRSQKVAEPVLVVNGFDRVAPPIDFREGNWSGFAGFLDEGVPDRYDIGFVGDQYDFQTDSPWLDDDAPGHGASYADYETRVLVGNTFDYPKVHGKALLSAGFSFVSASDEAVADQWVDLADYTTVDLILGEERTTHGPGTNRSPRFRTFPVSLQDVVRRFVETGGQLFVSGAYVGTDLYGGSATDSDKSFAEEVLHLKWRTDHASASGSVLGTDNGLMESGRRISFETSRTGSVYRVESPDAIEPADDATDSLLRYADNNVSAAVGVRSEHRVVVFGFPFETILGEENRRMVMQHVLDYLAR